MNKDVTIIILTHKSKKLVIEFIKNIHDKFKILIIDNSNDFELKQFINKNYPSIDVHIIENNGYGAAINYGSKFVKTDYFLISNPDVTGIDENKISLFIQSAKKLNNKFSALGPRYLNANSKSLKQSKDNNSIAEMQFLNGACMFFLKENFVKLGGFDEKIFLYFEENDFCKRSHKINKNYQINNIKIKHNTGTSVEISNEDEKIQQSNLRTWHFIWSKFYFYKKKYGKFISLIIFVPQFLRIILRISLYFLNSNKDKKEKYLIRYNGLMTSIKGKKSSIRINDFN